MACQGYHRSVAVQQATVAEVFQQDAEVWEVVELTMKDVVSDLLLEHPPHPLDICAALPFAVGSGLRFSGTCGLAHERSKPGRRKNWRVASRQKPDEVEGASFWEPDNKIVSLLPCALVVTCPVPNIVPHRIIAAGKSLAAAQALDNVLDPHIGGRCQGKGIV